MPPVREDMATTTIYDDIYDEILSHVPTYTTTSAATSGYTEWRYNSAGNLTPTLTPWAEYDASTGTFIPSTDRLTDIWGRGDWIPYVEVDDVGPNGVGNVYTLNGNMGIRRDFSWNGIYKDHKEDECIIEPLDYVEKLLEE